MEDQVTTISTKHTETIDIRKYILEEMGWLDFLPDIYIPSDSSTCKYCIYMITGIKEEEGYLTIDFSHDSLGNLKLKVPEKTFPLFTKISEDLLRLEQIVFSAREFINFAWDKILEVSDESRECHGPYLIRPGTSFSNYPELQESGVLMWDEPITPIHHVKIYISPKTMELSFQVGLERVPMENFLDEVDLLARVILCGG